MTTDFERVDLLLHVVDNLAKHGTTLNHLQAAAMKELNDMNQDANPNKPEPRQLKAVTPAAGPANSAVETSDGTVVPRAPTQPYPTSTRVEDNRGNEEDPFVDRKNFDRAADAQANDAANAPVYPAGAGPKTNPVPSNRHRTDEALINQSRNDPTNPAPPAIERKL